MEVAVSIIILCPIINLRKHTKINHAIEAINYGEKGYDKNES